MIHKIEVRKIISSEIIVYHAKVIILLFPQVKNFNSFSTLYVQTTNFKLLDVLQISLSDSIK